MNMTYIDRTETVNGLEVSYLALTPLVSRLRRYFNCSSIKGAYLENQGDSSNQLSHFERRIFYNEVNSFSLRYTNRVIVYDSK